MDKSKDMVFTESVQLIEQLYSYLVTLDIGLPIRLEYLKGTSDELAIKQIAGSFKTKSNILGGYEAEMPFAIYSGTDVSDTKSVLSITEPLNRLALTFESETENEFPNLKLNGLIPIKLEMVSTPADNTGKEDGGAVFMALYKLTYKKKSKYE